MFGLIYAVLPLRFGTHTITIGIIMKIGTEKDDWEGAMSSKRNPTMMEILRSRAQWLARTRVSSQ